MPLLTKARPVDPLLTRFLEAETPQREEEELEALIACVGPAMRQFIRQKVLLYAEGATPTERIERARQAEARARKELHDARTAGATPEEVSRKQRALDAAQRHVSTAEFGGGRVSREAEHGEDLYREAVYLLLRRLRDLKTAARESRSLPGSPSGNGGAPIPSTIEKFDGLAIIVVRNLLNEHLRRKYPRRRLLRQQVVGVLKWVDPETGRQPLALWERDWLPEVEHRAGLLGRFRGGSGRKRWEKLGGLQEWKGRGVQSTPELCALFRDPIAFAEARPDLDVEAENLLRLLEEFFLWLKTPMEVDYLVTTMARLRKVQDVPVTELDRPTDGDGEGAVPIDVADKEQRLDEELFLKNTYLPKLWAVVKDLQPHYVAALLLNLTEGKGDSLLYLLPQLGIAGIRQIAGAMDLPPERLAELWPELPLDDRRIGELYRCPAGRVAIWRFRARQRLAPLAHESGVAFAPDKTPEKTPDKRNVTLG